MKKSLIFLLVVVSLLFVLVIFRPGLFAGGGLILFFGLFYMLGRIIPISVGLIVIAVGYYIYSEFIKKKDKEVSSESERDIESRNGDAELQVKKHNKVEEIKVVSPESFWEGFIKMLILIAPVAFVLVSIIFIFLVEPDNFRSGLDLLVYGGVLLAPLWIFDLGYFAFLALKYKREGNDMAIFDKIVFYVFLLGIIVVGMAVVYCNA